MECFTAVYLQTQRARARCVAIAFKADLLCPFPWILGGFTGFGGLFGFFFLNNGELTLHVCTYSKKSI